VSTNVVYVMPDKMGGVLNIVASLLAHRSSPDHHVVLTHNTLSTDTRFAQPLQAATQTTVEYTLPVENIHAVLRRLRDALPPGGGVLVTNDLLELALLHVHDPGRMVVQLLHGDHDYYYDLAVRHDSVIDVFVAYGRSMFDGLRARLPHRTGDIYHLPYGVPLPATTRQPVAGPLRLLFAGRLDHGQKGVFDLPVIDRLLRERGIDYRWTIIGGGPDEAQLRSLWTNGDVDWRGVLTHADVLRALPEFDVFVLPTRAEGFSVALVEAMGAGLVPVISDIPSGVPEVIEDGVNGFTPTVGDNAGFTEAIATVAADRARLEAMSTAARDMVATRFNVSDRIAGYEALYDRWRELRRPRGAHVPLPYGSRLDQSWLSNALVRTIRIALRRASGRPV